MTEIDWRSLKAQADDATKPVPVGDYDVVVEKAEHRMASTGANMVVCTLKVEGGPSHGKTIFNNFVLSPDKAFALAMWFRNLAAFGLDDSFFAQQPSLPQVAAALVGRRARVTLSIRAYQGQDRNQCDAFTAPSTPQPALLVAAAPATSAGAPGLPPTPGPGLASGPPVGLVPPVPGVPPTPVPPSAPPVPGTPAGPATPAVPEPF